MARRPRLLEAAAVIALAAGCAPVHPARGELAPAAVVAVRRPTTTSPPVQGPAPAEPATTTPLTGDGPAATAARFALAYLNSPPGDNPEKRRQRCRPFDTDKLDALLAVPTWDGATNPPTDQGAVAAVNAINPVDDTAQGIGYELTVTTTTNPTGRQHHTGRADVVLWVTTTIDGWRVSQVSIT